jgi:cellulose synthase/poly-beta-1,6-N-acetylglucosamine synthase-like glycosyltransferase
MVYELAGDCQNNNFYQILIIFLLFYVLKFSSHSILLGGGKEKVLSILYSGAIILKKNANFSRKKRIYVLITII